MSFCIYLNWSRISDKSNNDWTFKPLVNKQSKLITINGVNNTLKFDSKSINWESILNHVERHLVAQFNSSQNSKINNKHKKGSKGYYLFRSQSDSKMFPIKTTLVNCIPKSMIKQRNKKRRKANTKSKRTKSNENIKIKNKSRNLLVNYVFILHISKLANTLIRFIPISQNLINSP